MVRPNASGLGFDGYVLEGFGFVAPIAKNLEVCFRVHAARDQRHDMVSLPLVAGA